MKTLTKPQLLSALFASTCLGPLALSLPIPAQAATFSGVGIGIWFDNFSHPALSTATNAETDTLALSSGGSVIAVSDAEAIFISGLEPGTETKAFNLITSSAEGSGGNYFGLAQSESSLVGDFHLAAQETFFFSFNGFLALATAIDNATYESAFARGGAGFSVLSNAGDSDAASLLLDQLGLLATLDTPGTQDILNTNLFALLLAGNTGNIVIDSLNFDRQIGELEEFISVNFSGRYSRTFQEPTAECVNKNETETKKKLVWNCLAVRSRHRRIDPNGRGHHGWAGRMMDKALRMGEISGG
jgi:hypothetical protein